MRVTFCCRGASAKRNGCARSHCWANLVSTAAGFRTTTVLHFITARIFQIARRHFATCETSPPSPRNRRTASRQIDVRLFFLQRIEHALVDLNLAVLLHPLL